MLTFEILCVTMHQKDFSKIHEMNIHSNVVFANQADDTAFEQIEFENHVAKMITTATRGVGINRNLALTYATADICLFADDDVVYYDDYKEKVLKEFEAHPDADIFIFHFDTCSERKQVRYSKTKKWSRFGRQPWGGVRIAIRLNSIRKANLHFTTLFGGGCVFPCGEDSMWLTEAKRKGLKFYVSKETIGEVTFNTSTWFSGYNEAYFYGKGAYYAAVRKLFFPWMLYGVIRMRNLGDMSIRQKVRWMKNGAIGYREMLSYQDFLTKYAHVCK